MKNECSSFLAWVMCVSIIWIDKVDIGNSESSHHDQSEENISQHNHSGLEIIRYHTLVKYGAVVFSHSGMDTYKALVIETAKGTPGGEAIYVGARNWLIKFDLTLRKPKALSIPASPEEIEKCKKKGKPADDCQNFIMFVEVTKIGDVGTILACGTYAHSPNCLALEAVSMTDELTRLDGLSSGTPHAEVVQYVMNDEVYIGISSESQGSSGKILRTTWEKNVTTIRSMEGKRWLNDVQFVGAFSPTKDHKFVYFVFRESAIDADGRNSTKSRVSRICKDDTGAVGDYKNYFSTFTKAYLACGEFHQVQDVSYKEHDAYFWGTFSGGDFNEGSAICRYKIIELFNVFEGDYFHPDPSDKRWEEIPPPGYHKEDDYKEVETCYSIRSMKSIMQFTMMSKVVSPLCNEPAFRSNVTLNKIATTYGENNDLFIFTGDELGRVWKMDFTEMFLNKKCISIATKYMHIWQVIPPRESAKEINRLSIFNESLIVLTKKAVMKIPLRYPYPEEEEEEPTNVKRNENSSSIPTMTERIFENETKFSLKPCRHTTTKAQNDSRSRLKLASSQSTLFVISTYTFLLTFA